MYIVDIADGIDAAHYILSMLWRLLGSFGDMVRFPAHLQLRFQYIDIFQGTRCIFYHQIIEWICKKNMCI
jgi:hypothetical protein